MARNHDPHDRLMALRDQVVRDKASQRMYMRDVEDLKARGAVEPIRSIQREMDTIDARIRATEVRIKELEIRLSRNPFEGS